jgi:hypothetical protein
MYKISTCTVPAAASTTTIHSDDMIDGLDVVDSMIILADLVGVTGGTLDVYLQVAPKEADIWMDYAHFTQLGAGAAAITRAWSVTRFAQVTSVATVARGDVPALAANTILGGDFGERMRVITVTGGGVSAGADITIRLIGSEVKRRN